LRTNVLKNVPNAPNFETGYFSLSVKGLELQKLFQILLNTSIIPFERDQ